MTCPVCGRRVRLTRDGRFAKHASHGATTCPNSGAEALGVSSVGPEGAREVPRPGPVGPGKGRGAPGGVPGGPPGADEAPQAPERPQGEPGGRAAAVEAVREAARRHEAAGVELVSAVAALRATGASWHVVGQALDLTAEGARRRYRHRLGT